MVKCTAPFQGYEILILHSVAGNCILFARQLAVTTRDTEREQLQRPPRRTITSTIEIDRLVYQLYGLTAEEIRIVDGTGT